MDTEMQSFSSVKTIPLFAGAALTPRQKRTSTECYSQKTTQEF